MLYRPYWKDKIKNADVSLENSLTIRDKYIAALENEIEKWETWKPDDETLDALQEQARARDGSYTNGLAAQAGYIGGLEGHVRAIRTRVASLEAALSEIRTRYGQVST